ncbi:MAG TPA: YCF48-related protein [Burkholderiaceae bacterium]|nr:YCF48-related protein [Burkholderiaceae bacterium]
MKCKHETASRAAWARRAAAAGAVALAAVAAVVVALPAQAGTLADPLERPALVVRQFERSALLGLAQAGGRVVAVGEHGLVLLSDDGGAHWRQAATVPVSVTLTAVQFVGERTGWAVGHQGVVLRSDDAGEHWTRQLEGRAVAALLLRDAQSHGDAKAVAEAQRAVQEGADKPLLALNFVNEHEGFVAGAFNLLLATRDGGRTWQAVSSRLPNPKGAHLYAIERDGAEVLLAGEQGLLLHSSDGGERFERIVTPYAGSFFVVTREANGAWLVAGLRGNVLRSADAGKSWTALASPAPVSVTAALRDAQGGVWLANQAGQLLAPAAGAATLRLVSPTSAQQPAGLLRLADGTLLIAGWNGVSRVDTRARNDKPTTTP